MNYNIQSRIKRRAQERRFQEMINCLNQPKSQLPPKPEYSYNYPEHFQPDLYPKRLIPVDLNFGPLQSNKLQEMSSTSWSMSPKQTEMQQQASDMGQRYVRNRSTSHTTSLPYIINPNQSFPALPDYMKHYDQRNSFVQEQEFQSMSQFEQNRKKQFQPTTKSQYEPSEELVRVFREEFVKDDWKWDNNERGKKMKEDYDRFVSAELEKQKNFNPLLRRRMRERSWDPSSEQGKSIA